MALTGLAFAVIAVSGLDAYRSLQRAASERLQLQSQAASVAQLGDALIATARAYAMTGEPQFAARYSEARTELDGAVAKTLALAGGRAALPSGAEQGEIDLRRIEAEARRSVEAGNRPAAIELLFSPDYDDAQRRYLAGIAFLSLSVQERLTGDGKAADERLRTMMGIAALGCVFFVFLWLAVLAGLRRNIAANATAASERSALEAHIQSSQRLQSLSVLAGGIAHDFNNLLTGILSNAGTARRMLATNEPVQKQLSEVVQGSKMAGHLTGQLLAYAGKGQFDVHPRDLSSEIGEIEDLLETSVRRKARLHFELSEGLPAILVDPSQLQQILLNLIINAAESIEGEVEVTIRTFAADFGADDILGLVPGSPLEEGRCVVLEVEDSGWGMDEETLGRIFDPFFTTKTEGRGLGLATTIGIVHRHEGGIQVQSKLGAGTTFRVAFPASGEIVRHVTEPPVSDLSGHGVVLIVDDDEYILHAVYLALESYGYSVLVANNGRTAVEVYEDHRDEIDLVLLDMSMPGMSGEETFRALREIRPDVSVLLTTGYAPDEAARKFTETDLAGFLRKPYDTDTLAAKVKRLIAPEADTTPAPGLATALTDLRAAYRERLPAQVEALVDALRRAREPDGADALEEARQMSHRIAGTAGSYGLDKVNERLECIDTLLREHLDGDADDPWDEIDAALADVWTFLGAESSA